MILIHRLTPFAIALLAAVGFVALLRASFHPALTIAMTGCLLFVLSARLATWQPASFRFWVFTLTPVLLFLSASGVLIFLEPGFARPSISVLVVAMLFLFAEFVFDYLYLPAKYQAYSIEHLSLAMNVFTMFFVSVSGFAARMFLQVPLWFASAVFFVCASFVIFETLWVSKVENRAAFPYAFSGAVLSTELFSVATFLPTGYFTTGALMAVLFYLFLGLTRAHFTRKLTRSVLRRYLFVSILLSAGILATSRWL